MAEKNDAALGSAKEKKRTKAMMSTASTCTLLPLPQDGTQPNSKGKKRKRQKRGAKKEFAATSGTGEGKDGAPFDSTGIRRQGEKKRPKVSSVSANRLSSYGV